MVEAVRRFDDPLMPEAGFLVLKGNLFDSAIMKTSVISEEFRARYLSEPGREGVFEGRAIVFDGSDDYHHRINDPALEIDEDCILVIRGAGRSMDTCSTKRSRSRRETASSG